MTKSNEVVSRGFIASNSVGASVYNVINKL